MATRFDIKKFHQDPACRICGRHVRGWGRAQCDNCGCTVCRRHKQLFAKQWFCPECKQRQQAFAPQIAPSPDSSNRSDSSNPAPTQASASDLLTKLAAAQELYELDQSEDAEALIADLAKRLI